MKAKSTRLWVIIIAVLLLVSVSLAVAMNKIMSTGSVANVYLNGECIDSIDLDKVDGPYSFTVKGRSFENVVEVEAGRISVASATCPDKVCVNQGWISNGAVPIVCLPNRLVIQIEEAPGKQSGVDGVSR